MNNAEQVEISTLAEALAWGDGWRAAYERLEREHAEALRELSLQRIMADDFADAWHRLYWRA